MARLVASQGEVDGRTKDWHAACGGHKDNLWLKLGNVDMEHEADGPQVGYRVSDQLAPTLVLHLAVVVVLYVQDRPT